MALIFARDEWLFFRGTTGTDGSKTAMSFKGDSDLDTVVELTQAVDDLTDALDGTSGSGFEEKQKNNLITASVSDTYDVAKDEWSLKKQWAKDDGKCELCGHNPIVYHFQIENKLNHNRMILGSSCILSYVVLAGFTRKELRIYLDRLRARLQDRRFDAVDQDTLDVWDKQDVVFASLKGMMGDIPSDFDIAEYEKMVGAFRRVSGFTLPDAFAKWLSNISVMRRVMEKTYSTTLVRKIPDKIRRKQKIKGKKVDDAHKLKLFIEYETQLHVLLQFGSPTEAYDMILSEYRNFLSKQLDELEDSQTTVDSGIIRHFTEMKKDVGNRSRVKGYIDEWKDSVLLSVEEAFNTYETQLGDIDAMLAGTTRYFTAPSQSAKQYILNWQFSAWQGKHPGHIDLYKILQIAEWSYVPLALWSNDVAPDHPIRNVKSISSVDLKAAILSSLDAGKFSPKDIIPSGIMVTSRTTCLVAASVLLRNPDILSRLMGDSDAFRDAIADAKEAADEAAKAKAKAEAKAEQDRLHEEQKFSDMVADAVKFQDPNNSREQQFVEDMQLYKRVAQLTTPQLRWLRGIANRSAAPQSTSTASAPKIRGKLTKVPSNGKMSLTEFLEACRETMRVGREDGFVDGLLKRGRIKKWDDLSPRQQKWLTDIFTRGNKRDMPDNITRR